MRSTGSRTTLPLIPRESWRSQAACPEFVDERLWDDRVDGETEEERLARHERAKVICWGRCQVRKDCSDSVDWRYDEGVRGGHKLPTMDLSRSKEDEELARLLKKGWPLDIAVRGSARHSA